MKKEDSIPKYKTYNVTPLIIRKKWYLIDAKDQILGKVAAKASYILRGKHKTIYTPYLDTGDNVIIINADKIRVTGKKLSDKIYYSHSGYPGGLKKITLEKLLDKNPVKPLELAIKGMLPKGPLGRKLFNNLRVYAGSEYKEVSQKPIKVEKL
ncbi:MAG TPA: 50S ribosomal protein L13 [Spirochaetota bacterium]|nr:50S ribosomal protein L13 [Spirochaetota bacterium]HOL56355.1 50S ribosomal protein L13 [Spirochaetota bacterium]HPP03855.1 50S ribosomal protein L13 [Spirochaetota bacterium]